ncbi:MAG: MutH/Sau3AI family endonuclease [Thermoleophilia bacterium]|nr:MutH/Sau3AI family endonuclease [Thermoleophilia bacterium]MDH4345509.1 MutH/Sau3AI family endonuclease [Thermoleophilia bacterium]MDH5314627.1 MutH/Sau3AI family endonuclease [Actinomycetota bacterium]
MSVLTTLLAHGFRLPDGQPGPDLGAREHTRREPAWSARFNLLRGRRHTGKSEVGHAVEAFFGIPRNSLPEADFPGAGIELKVVPTRRTGRGLGIKERTVISMIDYRDGLGDLVTSKGTISFQYGQRLPVTLVKKVVKSRLAEVRLATGGAAPTP